MKKSIQFLKTIVAVAIVLVMAQGCVPAGGTTPTSGTFNIGINDNGRGNFSNTSNQYDVIRSKIILIDGDSIGFVMRYGYDGNGGYAASENISIFTKSSTGNTYEFLSVKNHQVWAPLATGVTISNNVDTMYEWNSNLTNPFYYPLITNYERFDNNFGFTAWEFQLNDFYLTTSLSNINDNAANFFDYIIDGENYFVFRRLKPNGYQYYWVKIISWSPVTMALLYGSGNGTFFRIENGKYQMNSIVTGQ